MASAFPVLTTTKTIINSPGRVKDGEELYWNKKVEHRGRKE